VAAVSYLPVPPPPSQRRSQPQRHRPTLVRTGRKRAGLGSRSHDGPLAPACSTRLGATGYVVAAV